jgi:hypothetical protein
MDVWKGGWQEEKVEGKREGNCQKYLLLIQWVHLHGLFC